MEQKPWTIDLNIRDYAERPQDHPILGKVYQVEGLRNRFEMAQQLTPEDLSQVTLEELLKSIVYAKRLCPCEDAVLVIIDCSFDELNNLINVWEQSNQGVGFEKYCSCQLDNRHTYGWEKLWRDRAEQFKTELGTHLQLTNADCIQIANEAYHARSRDRSSAKRLVRYYNLTSPDA